MIIIFGGGIVAGILGAIGDTMALVGSAVGGLAYLAGIVIMILNYWKMLNELKAVTNNPDFHPWWMFGGLICGLFLLYFFAVRVPEEMNKAKQMTGAQTPTRSIILYLFLTPYALASDLNDMAG